MAATTVPGADASPAIQFAGETASNAARSVVRHHEPLAAGAILPGETPIPIPGEPA